MAGSVDVTSAAAALGLADAAGVGVADGAAVDAGCDGAELAAGAGDAVASTAGGSLAAGVAVATGDSLGSAAETVFTPASCDRRRTATNSRVRLDIRGCTLGIASLDANSTDG